MTTIRLVTKIKAPLRLVFDLNRDIDLHQQSIAKSMEKAISGVTTGLINLNETVTWRGRHFGFYLTHKSLITAMEIPNSFIDEMIEGHFRSFTHLHTFKEENGIVTMHDEIQYEVPFGIPGKLFDKLVLKKYLTKLIAERNEFVRNLAEQEKAVKATT